MSLPGSVPEPIREATEGYTWYPVTAGMSTASTWRLERRGSASLYLKKDRDQFPDELADERSVIEWLAGRLSSPRVVTEGTASGARWLLITALFGEMAHEVERDHSSVVSLVAGKLREIHEIDPETCPFDRGLPKMLQSARSAIDYGLVDPTDFDREHLGRPIEALWDDLNESIPDRESRVFCHGDFCLPNVLISGQGVSGVIDWGRAGVSDRYRDLAIASRSIGDNFGVEYEPQFFKAYGAENVDQDKVRFYRMLDEFF